MFFCLGYQKIDIIHGDSAKQLFLPNSIDVILVDLPFYNLKTRTIEGNEILYPKIFQICKTILNSKTGRMIFITTKDNEKILNSILIESKEWIIQHSQIFRVTELIITLIYCIPNNDEEKNKSEQTIFSN